MTGKEIIDKIQSEGWEDKEFITTDEGEPWKVENIKPFVNPEVDINDVPYWVKPYIDAIVIK